MGFRYGGEDKWFRATVTHRAREQIEGEDGDWLYDLEYNDGDDEEEIARDAIRPAVWAGGALLSPVVRVKSPRHAARRSARLDARSSHPDDP